MYNREAKLSDKWMRASAFLGYTSNYLRFSKTAKALHPTDQTKPPILFEFQHPKKNTFSRPFNINGYIYIYVYRGFPKMGVPPTHPKLDHFSIDTYGFGDPFHFKKPPHLSSMSEIS